jgi:hypothetical protein
MEEGCPITIKNPVSTGGKTVHVVTDLYWISEKDASETPHGKDNLVRISNYEYCLELDGNRNVVGGAWISYLRPDFIWMVGKPDLGRPVTDTVTGGLFDFVPLLELYARSRTNQSMPLPAP